MIKCADGIKIHSWLLYHPDNAQKRRVPTIIWFHGNAGNIGLRLPQAMQMFHYLKANVWMIEYRGYGDSDDARPNESGLKLDAEAVWEHANNKTLLPNADPKRMFVFGQSLGGAVAFHLAQYSQSTSYPPLAGVILENTFISISEMVDHLMPYVAPLKMLILRMYWNSGKIAPIIRIPTLFLAGARDTLVPHVHMITLFNHMKSSKVKTLVRLHVVKDGTHNETWMQGGREYWMAIQRFFDEVFAAENSSGASYARSASAAASVRGDGPLFQRKASVSAGVIAAAASSASGECADASDRKESVAVDLGGEDAAEMISSVGNFIGMAREATRTVGGSKGVGGAVAYKKKD